MAAREDDIDYCIEPFNGNNFSLFKRRVEAIFAAKELDDYLEKEPDETKVAEVWKARKVYALLLRLLDGSILVTLAAESSACEMWTSLKKRYQKVSAVSQVVVRKKLETLRPMDSPAEIGCSESSVYEECVVTKQSNTKLRKGPKSREEAVWIEDVTSSEDEVMESERTGEPGEFSDVTVQEVGATAPDSLSVDDMEVVGHVSEVLDVGNDFHITVSDDHVVEDLIRGLSSGLEMSKDETANADEGDLKGAQDEAEASATDDGEDDDEKGGEVEAEAPAADHGEDDNDEKGEEVETPPKPKRGKVKKSRARGDSERKKWKRKKKKKWKKKIFNLDCVV